MLHHLKENQMTNEVVDSLSQKQKLRDEAAFLRKAKMQQSMFQMAFDGKKLLLRNDLPS